MQVLQSSRVACNLEILDAERYVFERIVSSPLGTRRLPIHKLRRTFLSLDNRSPYRDKATLQDDEDTRNASAPAPREAIITKIEAGRQGGLIVANLWVLDVSHRVTDSLQHAAHGSCP